MEKPIMGRPEKLEKTNRRLMAAFIGAISTLFPFAIVAYKNSNSGTGDILKAKGFVIVDEKSNPRIAMVAPIHQLEGRKRNDDLVAGTNDIQRLRFELNGTNLKGKKV